MYESKLSSAQGAVWCDYLTGVTERNEAHDRTVHGVHRHRYRKGRSLLPAFTLCRGCPRVTCCRYTMYLPLSFVLLSMASSTHTHTSHTHTHTHTHTNHTNTTHAHTYTYISHEHITIHTHTHTHTHIQLTLSLAAHHGGFSRPHVLCAGRTAAVCSPH